MSQAATRILGHVERFIGEGRKKLARRVIQRSSLPQREKQELHLEADRLVVVSAQPHTD